MRDLPIGPTEAFVLSRVEGATTKAELVTATGLSAEEVDSIVARLILLGALEFAERQSMTQPTQASAHRSGAHSIPLTARSETLSELSAEQQQALLDLDRRCASLDHYQLLGIEPNADVKTIRAAYYELVRVYHPDRFFGRKLGELEAPLLRVFGKFSEAYEVLHRPETRAEYDRYRGARLRTVDFDRYFQDAAGESLAPAPNAPVSNAPASGPSIPSPAGASPLSSNPPVPLGTGSVAPRDAHSRESLRHPSSAPPSDPDARRRALARKLGHSSLPPSSASQQMPAVNEAARAADELRRRYEQRLAHAREDQIKHYVALSAEANERNDLVAAANMLRIACSLAPDSLELAGDLAELERRVATSLWESYLDRAKYAAVEGSYAEAAESYERAALGQPNPAFFERAAHYTLEANGDLRKASKLAKQAVALSPNSAKCRLTLARVYFAANLQESALAELERARAIEPNQPILKEWIARVKRGE
ncbi:MAG TPA: DnaJ domain-containing protein [Polyangiaceae bacterium]|nr:DnaJ domain-containing protein [Polyangiaceae bacterium]